MVWKRRISAYELSQKLLEYGVGIQFLENKIFAKNPMELLKMELWLRCCKRRKSINLNALKLE